MWEPKLRSVRCWQACNKRQVELQDELADLLETLVDRYVSLCAEHGIKPYGGHQDYETAELISRKASEWEKANQ